jgi:hypothetical protein
MAPLQQQTALLWIEIADKTSLKASHVIARSAYEAR